MIRSSVAEVAEAVDGRLVAVPPDRAVARVVVDSRRVADVDVPTLFVARRGEQQDGHDHAADAVAAGAVVVLAERELPGLPCIVVADSGRALVHLAAAVRDRSSATVVAVTGSVGKTTTKDLTAAAAGAAGPVVAARGSYNNEVGVPLTVLDLAPDTRTLVAELGARGVGQIAELASWVRPDVSIVTAVAGVHLELFGTIDRIAATKGELVEALPPSGTAVLNHDDHRVAAMAERTRARILRCSAAGAHDADLAAADVALDPFARPCFVARTPWGEVDVRLGLAGRHNVTNALLALAAAGAAGAPLEDAAARLADADVSRWRGEVVDLGDAIVLNDAYNANPTSTIAALDTLAAMHVSGRRIGVLGVMAEIGDDHDAEHRRVGAHAADVLDLLVVVGDEVDALAAGAREAGLDDVRTVADAATAADSLRPLHAGDAVLVKASRVAGLEEVTARLSDGEVARP